MSQPEQAVDKQRAGPHDAAPGAQHPQKQGGLSREKVREDLFPRAVPPLTVKGENRLHKGQNRRKVFCLQQITAQSTIPSVNWFDAALQASIERPDASARESLDRRS